LSRTYWEHIDLPLLGEAANDVSPRVGHLHVSLDDLPWHWGEFSNDGTIVVVGLPAGPHKLRTDLAGPAHKVFTGETVAFVVPVAARFTECLNWIVMPRFRRGIRELSFSRPQTRGWPA
jgi:hypothetical protein